jgi:hypothetical protein
VVRPESEIYVNGHNPLIMVVMPQIKGVMAMRIRSVNFNIVILLLFGAIVCNAQDAMYDYSESTEYRALDVEEREKLDQVIKDLQSLEAAIRKHMLDHKGAAPKTLESLIPKYLPSLPRDPFFTPRKPDDHCQKSLSGAGYLYRRRPGPKFVTSWDPLTLDPLTFQPADDSWQIRSVGLPDFPLRYSPKSKNGRGLVHRAGYWGHFIIDVF